MLITKFLLNHNNKYPNCNLSKHFCQTCNYKTNVLRDYNKHLSTVVHMSKNNICNVCLKQFRDIHDYNRHLNRKTKCNIVIENEIKSEPEAIKINLEQNNLIDQSDKLNELLILARNINSINWVQLQSDLKIITTLVESINN